jgi:hypothetical protein
MLITLVLIEKCNNRQHICSLQNKKEQEIERDYPVSFLLTKTLMMINKREKKESIMKSADKISRYIKKLKENSEPKRFEIKISTLPKHAQQNIKVRP